MPFRSRGNAGHYYLLVCWWFWLCSSETIRVDRPERPRLRSTARPCRQEQENVDCRCRFHGDLVQVGSQARIARRTCSLNDSRFLLINITSTRYMDFDQITRRRIPSNTAGSLGSAPCDERDYRSLDALLCSSCFESGRCPLRSRCSGSIATAQRDCQHPLWLRPTVRIHRRPYRQATRLILSRSQSSAPSASGCHPRKLGICRIRQGSTSRSSECSARLPRLPGSCESGNLASLDTASRQYHGPGTSSRYSVTPACSLARCNVRLLICFSLAAA